MHILNKADLFESYIQIKITYQRKEDTNMAVDCSGVACTFACAGGCIAGCAVSAFTATALGAIGGTFGGSGTAIATGA